jgi:hypothetical protein
MDGASMTNVSLMSLRAFYWRKSVAHRGHRGSQRNARGWVRLQLKRVSSVSLCVLCVERG